MRPWTLVPVCAAVLISTHAVWAQTTPRLAEPPCCGIELAQQMPEYDGKVGAWGGGAVPGNEGADPVQQQNTATSASVTVTAVVLPVRIITIKDSKVSISSNTHDEASWWSVVDGDGTKLALTQRMWDAARDCMAGATKHTGLVVCRGELSD